MIWAITMPTWGLSMQEGTIVGWRVAEGSPTAAGAELVEIETSKIANSLEAREAGVLRRQLVKAGQMRHLIRACFSSFHRGGGCAAR